MAVRALLLFVCSLWLMPAHAVRAQERVCGDSPREVSGDFELTPEDGARDVARNAPITLRYADDVDLDALAESVAGEDGGVLCAGELLCLLETRDEPRAIEAQLERDADAGTLELTPSEPLAADTEHTVLIVQPGLDAVARLSRSFRTGDAIDRDRPTLPYSGDDIVVLSVSDVAPECDAPAGSQRIRLELPPAEDDADPESVMLEIYTAHAYQQRGERLVARTRNDVHRVYVSFVLDARSAAHPLCVRVRAIDGVGRIARDEPELCFDPSRDVRFASGCSIAAGRAAGLSHALVLLALLLGARRRSRSTRAHP